MIIANTEDRHQMFAPIEATCLGPEWDTIAVVHHKRSMDRETQMSCHKAVVRNDYEKLEHKWIEEVQLSNETAGYRKQFLDILIKFQSMWDIKLRQVYIAKHRFKVALKQFILYSTGRGQMPESLKKQRSTK